MRRIKEDWYVEHCFQCPYSIKIYMRYLPVGHCKKAHGNVKRGIPVPLEVKFFRQIPEYCPLEKTE